MVGSEPPGQSAHRGGALVWLVGTGVERRRLARRAPRGVPRAARRRERERRGAVPRRRGGRRVVGGCGRSGPAGARIQDRRLAARRRGFYARASNASRTARPIGGGSGPKTPPRSRSALEVRARLCAGRNAGPSPGAIGARRAAAPAAAECSAPPSRGARRGPSALAAWSGPSRTARRDFPRSKRPYGTETESPRRRR